MYKPSVLIIVGAGSPLSFLKMIGKFEYYVFILNLHIFSVDFFTNDMMQQTLYFLISVFCFNFSNIHSGG